MELSKEEQRVSLLQRTVHKLDYTPTKDDVVFLLGHIVRLSHERDRAEVQAVRAVGQTYEALARADEMDAHMVNAQEEITSQLVAATKAGQVDVVDALHAVRAAAERKIEKKNEEVKA